MLSIYCPCHITMGKTPMHLSLEVFGFQVYQNEQGGIHAEQTLDFVNTGNVQRLINDYSQAVLRNPENMDLANRLAAFKEAKALFISLWDDVEPMTHLNQCLSDRLDTIKRTYFSGEQPLAYAGISDLSPAL
jgi:hypothetical protein